MTRWILAGAVGGLLVACKANEKKDATELATKADSSDVAALVARVDALQSEVSALTSQVDDLQSSLATVSSDVTTLQTDVTDIQGTGEPFVQLIDADRTLDPSPGDSIADALATLKGYAIADNATVTLQLGAGTYPLDQTLHFKHHNGRERRELRWPGLRRRARRDRQRRRPEQPGHLQQQRRLRLRLVGRRHGVRRRGHVQWGSGAGGW